MEQEAHVSEFMKPAIDVASSSSHSILNQQLGPADPFVFDVFSQSADDLPPSIASQRREQPPRG
jgi:hypothetical protein